MAQPMTEDELLQTVLQQGLSDQEALALFKKNLSGKTETTPAAPAAPVRAVKPPAAPSPRPAPAAATKPPPLATLATSRAKAPPPAEPAREAMPAAVTPIVATAQTPPAAPVVVAPAPPTAPAKPAMSDAQLATEEQIQLERMLAEQDAIREAQNVGYVREAMMPLAALAAPAVLATGPFSAPLATVATFAPGAAAAFPQAVAGGLSKLGFYGKTEATPEMRQEARRRALAAAGTQQSAASDRNIGSYLAEGVLDLPASMMQPVGVVTRGAQAASRAVGEILEEGKRPFLFGERITPEEFALSKGGEFAQNARRVKAAPEKFIPVGPRNRDTEAVLPTGREYELVVSPKVAYREHNAQFQDWAKRFPKEAEAVRAEVAKESAAERSVRKAETATSEVVAQVRAGRIPTAEQLGVSREEHISLLKIAGLTPADLRANSMSEESATRLSEALKATRTPAP